MSLFKRFHFISTTTTKYRVCRYNASIYDSSESKMLRCSIRDGTKEGASANQILYNWMDLIEVVYTFSYHSTWKRKEEEMNKKLRMKTKRSALNVAIDTIEIDSTKCSYFISSSLRFIRRLLLSTQKYKIITLRLHNTVKIGCTRISHSSASCFHVIIVLFINLFFYLKSLIS